MIPLQWIYENKGSEALLFKLLDNEKDKLQGSVLLDAMFTAFWKNKKKEI